MAWFEIYFECPDCGVSWRDQWSCACDDICPGCGLKGVEPVTNDDLTVVVEHLSGGGWTVLFSPSAARHEPEYVTLGTTKTFDAAKRIEDAAWVNRAKH